MSSLKQLVVMNEEAFAKLGVFPHNLSTHKNANVYKWKFYDKHNVLTMLEFNCWYLTLKTSCTYIEELYVYSLDSHVKYFERICNVNEWLENNKSYLEQTRAIYNATNDVINRLFNHLGPCVCFLNDTYGWAYNSPKIQIKVFVHMYKDPNQKTIKLEYKDLASSKTKSGFVEKKQLYTFLKKNQLIR